jgi:hypothetical protein
MDSKHIEQLLEKYWNCETSLEEEKELRTYFGGSAIPSQLKETAQLFRYFEEEKKKSAGESFDEAIIKQVHPRKGAKVVQMLSNIRLSRIAAGVVVVLAAAYFIHLEVKKAYPDPIEDTYSDPKLAFEETKKALLMISRGFGKGKSEAGRIRMFNDAERQIQGKEEDKKQKINI